MAFRRDPVGVVPRGRTLRKTRSTSSGRLMFRYSALSDSLRKYISMPSASWAVQIGVMDFNASAVSFQLRPAMLPLSSIKKTVSKEERKAYGSSGVEAVGLVGEFDIGPGLTGATGEYSGGGSEP